MYPTAPAFSLSSNTLSAGAGAHAAVARSTSTFCILHVLFSSRIAGSERYCIDLANRQAAAGHEVHVAGRYNSPVRFALHPRVLFHGFRTRWFRGLLVRRLVQRLGADVCHGHLSSACKVLSHLSDITATVATLHVGYKAHQHERLDAVICVNHAQSGRLEKFRGIASTIPNWMPLTSGAEAGREFRNDLGLEDSAFVIGAVGRLHPSKGMDVLIQAFRLVASANARLVIVGEGPQHAELMRLRAGDARIHLMGYRDDVQHCLPSFDVFVSPSREESFGLAILEAMHARLPVIATAAEGPYEFLRDQPATMILPGSVEALAGAIEQAEHTFNERGTDRITYELDQFSAEERLSSINELYGQVLKSKRRQQAKQESCAVAVQ